MYLRTVIAIPPAAKPGPKPSYPFADLALGESFIIPASDDPKLPYLRTYCSRRSRELGRSFRCALLPDGSVQVWRQHDPRTIEETITDMEAAFFMSDDE